MLLSWDFRPKAKRVWQGEQRSVKERSGGAAVQGGAQRGAERPGLLLTIWGQRSLGPISSYLNHYKV